MKKLFIVVYVLLFVIFLKLVITFSINQVLLSKYEKGEYDTSLARNLFVLNVNEPYIAYYNYGNVLYQLNEYEQAITEYQNALNYNIPDDRICSVRINLVLSLVKNLGENLQVSKLKEARMLLYEDDCAHEYDDNGRSAQAEELEQYIRELEKQEPSDDNNNSGEGEDDEQKEETDSNKVEELEERNKNATSSRNEDLNWAENSGSYEYYDGKQW